MYQRFSLKVKLFLFEGFSDSEQLYSDFPSDSSRLFALVGVSDRAQVGRKIERGCCMFPKWVQRFSETTKRSSRQEVKGKRGHGRSAGFHTVSCAKPPVSCVHTREVTVQSVWGLWAAAHDIISLHHSHELSDDGSALSGCSTDGWNLFCCWIFNYRALWTLRTLTSLMYFHISFIIRLCSRWILLPVVMSDCCMSEV